MYIYIYIYIHIYVYINSVTIHVKPQVVSRHHVGKIT